MSPITRSKKRKIEAEIQPNSSKKQKLQSSYMNSLMNNPGFLNITEKILLHLVHKDLQSCRLVCLSWKMQVDQPHFWIKKCNQRGQPGDLFNAWFDLVRRIEKGSFLENELVKCIMTWHGVIHTYAKEELDGITPVHIATRCGFKDIVKFIASFVDNNVNAPKGNGVTPMFVAARFGHLNIVKFLGEKIENSYATEVEGWTPLQLAASNGHTKIVRYLAKKLGNPNQCCSDGWWTIHLAARYGYIEIVKSIKEMKFWKSVKFSLRALITGTLPCLKRDKKGENSTPKPLFCCLQLDHDSRARVRTGRRVMMTQWLHSLMC